MKALPETSLHEALSDETNREGQLAATRRLAELSAQWGLPIIPELTSDDISADALQAAIQEQVEFVESRVAKIAPGGNIKKWKNRNKMVLPFFFHTPNGRETIKRLVFASRFSQQEIALICQIKEEQINRFVKQNGWDKAQIALLQAKDIREWTALVKHKITDAKLKVTEAVLKGANTIAGRDGGEILRDLPKLRALHSLMEEIVPPVTDAEGNRTQEDGCTVNVGVEIVSHQRKKFDPVEAAKQAQASEIQPEEED